MQPSPLSANRLSAALVGIVAVVALVLLIGNRLDARFAGGEGYKAQPTMTFVSASLDPSAPPPSITENIVRGETVTTPAGVFLAYKVNDLHIWLDENSSILYKDGRSGEENFGFLTGNIVVSGQGAFTVRETQVQIHGIAILTNYSWMDQLEAFVIEGSAQIKYGEHPSAYSIAEGTGIRIDTLPPADLPTELTFDLENSKRREFYDWIFPSSETTTQMTDASAE